MIIMKPTPHEYNQSLIRAIEPPSLRYRAGEPFLQWQERAREKLNELLGLPFAYCPEAFAVEYTKVHEGFTKTRFTFESEHGYTVPCHFLTPAGAAQPLPVVICLQGHTTGMHLSLGQAKYPGDEEMMRSGDRDFALRAVKEGYCALTIEQRCFGECGGGGEKGTRCHESSMAALLIGRTTVGERVWDVMRAIDVLERHFPQADLEKIICMGNSGGGTTALFAACLEPRISFAMPSCFFCTFDDSIAAMNHCICNLVPGIRKFFDMGDLAGLIAPRPLVIVAGREDSIFPLHGVEKAFEVAKVMYAEAGVPERISLVIGEGGHRFYADDAWPVMNRYIRGT